ncbi:MAG: NUDIX domain-containing protein [Micrococcales bacterium]|nr:NUDIX domain-containing protein [Micrococcales bacterium]
MDDASPRYDSALLDSRTRLVAAAYVVLCRPGAENHEVLLLLRRGTGYRGGHWASLAGHVEPGESVHEAAVREAREESGVVIDPDDLVPLTVLHRFERGGPAIEQRVDVFFTTTRWRGVPTVCEHDKAAAMAWFPVDELPEPVVPHERLVLDALAGGAPVPGVISLPS